MREPVTTTHLGLLERLTFDPKAYGLGDADDLQISSTKELNHSPVCVGLETLDRELFDPEKTYPWLAELGAKWSRIQSGWSRCEKEKGVYDFTWLDDVVNNLLEIGVQPWMSLCFGNPLYNDDPSDPYAIKGVPVYGGEEAVEAWTCFVETVVTRYADRIDHFEIWNEPNGVGFWPKDKRDGKDYAKFVAMTAPVIRKAHPSANIIGFASGRVPLEFYDTALKEGICEHIDIVTYHPYNATPEKDHATHLETLRTMVGQYDSNIIFWQGETGTPSTSEIPTRNLKNQGITHMNEITQAKFAARRVIGDMSLGLPLTSLYHISDLYNYRNASEASKGPSLMGLLEGKTYTPKPSFRALQSVCTMVGDTDGPLRGLFRIGPDVYTSRFHTTLPYFSTIHVLMFKNGYPMAAYYVPEDLKQEMQTLGANIWTWIPGEKRIEDAVLIDPLRQTVYSIDVKHEGITDAFYNVPLTDYPLFITDRRAIT